MATSAETPQIGNNAVFLVRQWAGKACPDAQESWEQGIVARELLLVEPKKELLGSRNACGTERDLVASGAAAGLKGILGPDVPPAVLAQELGCVPLSLTPVPPNPKLQRATF